MKVIKNVKPTTSALAAIAAIKAGRKVERPEPPSYTMVSLTDRRQMRSTSSEDGPLKP